MLRRSFLFLLACVAAATATSGGSSTDCAVDHTAAAIEMDEAGDIRGAIASFTAAARCKRTSTAFANLGLALSEVATSAPSSSPAAEDADARAMRALVLACHLSGGTNTMAQTTLADVAERRHPGDRDGARAALAAAAAQVGADVATSIDMSSATAKYNSREDPVLER